MKAAVARAPIPQRDPRELEEELVRVIMSFEEFLKFVFVQDPVKGAVRWQPWPYLLEVARELQGEKLLAYLKARQLGLSWLVMAYVLWRCMRPDKLVMAFSLGEAEAWELIRKAEYIRTRLPAEWGMTRINDSKTEIELGNGSIIRAYPSTEKAGSGFAASIVVADEHHKHPYAAQNFATVEPCINAGGQFISLGTNWEPGFAMDIYNDGKAGLNGFKSKFLGCMLRPGRDEAWYEETKAKFKRLPAYFAREYPRTEAEALSSIDGNCAFDLEALNRLLEHSRPPIFEEKFTLGYLRQWQKPILGRHYVCGTDITYGLSASDAAVSQVIESQTGAHVASLWSHLPPEEHITRTIALCRDYNNAFLGVEENGVGQFAIRKLQDSGYYNVYYRDAQEAMKEGRRPTKMGWHTGQNRPILVAELGAAYRSGALITWDEETIKESRTFIIDNGKEEAAKGCHDDRVMAMGIAWQMRSRYSYMVPVGQKTHTRTFIQPR